MSADIQDVLAVIDGLGDPHTILTAEDPYGNQAYQFVLRTNGGMTSPSNPQPVSVPPVLPVESGLSLEGYYVLNNGPCAVCGIQVNTTGEPGWVMLFDAISPPADGSLITAPKKWWQVSQYSTLDKEYTTPLSMINGAVLVFSVTGPFTKTASATAIFSGETR